VWDRLRKPGEAESVNAEHSWAFRGDTLFSRTTDGGQTWEPPRTIYTRTSLTGTIGNQIAVLPDRTLVDIFDVAQGSGKNFPGFDIHVQRSTDLGETWSEPIQVAPERAVRVFDPDTDRSVRAGGGLPDIAVDRNQASPGYGNVYAVWGDRVGSPKKTPYPTVVFTESTDGGLTWSSPLKVNQSPAGVQAFTPAVAVASDGTVAVTYYDLRNNTPDPGVPTDFWMIHCPVATDCADPANWDEDHVAGSFDIERAPISNRGYYLGDYTGLTSIGTTFLPLFVQTTSTDQANTYLGVVTP